LQFCNGLGIGIKGGFDINVDYQVTQDINGDYFLTYSSVGRTGIDDPDFTVKYISEIKLKMINPDNLQDYQQIIIKPEIYKTNFTENGWSPTGSFVIKLPCTYSSVNLEINYSYWAKHLSAGASNSYTLTETINLK
jgi:hypothetical protein